MKTLILIRHAKSSMPTNNQSDFERTLEKSGEKDAEKIAQKLYDANFIIEQIIASNAIRTSETAIIFAAKNNIQATEIKFAAKLYNAPTYAYEDVVENLDNNKNVIAIVGHNNGISEYASSLLKDNRYFDMPTCAVLGFRASVNNWEDFGNAKKELLFFEAP
jgi:phosphohistidine phosphatase